MSPDEFRGLLDYSSSMPSGVHLEKCWKRDENANRRRIVGPRDLPPNWWMGEYAKHPTDPKAVQVNWYRIVIRERTFPIEGATYYAYWYGDGDPGVGDGRWMSAR